MYPFLNHDVNKKHILLTHNPFNLHAISSSSIFTDILTYTDLVLGIP